MELKKPVLPPFVVELSRWPLMTKSISVTGSPSRTMYVPSVLKEETRRSHMASSNWSSIWEKNGTWQNRQMDSDKSQYTSKGPELYCSNPTPRLLPYLQFDFFFLQNKISILVIEGLGILEPQVITYNRTMIYILVTGTSIVKHQNDLTNYRLILDIIF